MKRLITVLILALFLGSCSENDTTGTQKQVKNINEHLSTFKHKTLDLTGRTELNGSITGYFNDDELAMANVTTYSDLGRKVESYYFDGKDLIAVQKEEFTYNKPQYFTREMAVENGDSVWYDDAKTVLKATWHYFYDGRMVRWLEPGGKVVPENDRRYQFQSGTLLNDAEKLKKMLGE
jgi:hypothetical protein